LTNFGILQDQFTPRRSDFLDVSTGCVPGQKKLEGIDRSTEREWISNSPVFASAGCPQNSEGSSHPQTPQRDSGFETIMVSADQRLSGNKVATWFDHYPAPPLVLKTDEQLTG